ncbi:uncharacterized protein LOC115416221 [Sphaeramia orbicularis]|uniref:uncharacterized protein LOC115416221 n=1 Tax=Sphaeramia orbicularis TaxID=375764 RepID=UPI00117D2EDC|nr:uncharacterized protein LOC115416221 [Sphaeramia orbicularis]
MSVASTGDVISVSDTITGFVCKNSDQPSCKKCEDYRVRFLCPYDFFIQSQCWTDWFDRDDPAGDSGDWETLKDLRKENPGGVCDIPLQIEVRTTAGLSVASTGNVISVSDTTTGFICKNSDQETGMCYDYRVRFLCPPDFCRPKAPGCYTDWFDLDDPSGFGDSETLAALRDEYPERICKEPQQIHVLTISGLTMDETENHIHVADATTGFICKNDEQTHGTCQDFRVRFRCPTDFCTQKVCWTEWFDRDDPTASGDWELLSDLRKKFPEDICEKPLGIEVVTVDTNIPVASTGQATYIYSPTVGFVCRNQDQSCHQCFDYKVRFGCPCPCDD